ncbi:beta-1,6-N-acetylglucosaminyltransferase [Falsihalocynthiibacter sp. SS001]|uniref:DUF5927 domain-containing protein n=1 Tax=Falsihalocynthiibacter sp. SS001 TaxID=3349698 RepID=UPI0036D40900
MSLGVVMLVHGSLKRAPQVARHWHEGGCPVVIHVDKAVPQENYDALVSSLADLDGVMFCERHRCEWGRWSLVEATQAGAEMLLAKFGDVQHVLLASGVCMPLRPVTELRAYLGARPNTDFIESATTDDVPWTMDGLDKERFTLRFPFSWKKHRKRFDWYVRFQRKIGFKRRIPDGLVPHMGSQWWCLTRTTLRAILEAPDRAKYDKYFKRVWIPDESYFQSLARIHSTNIESRSLTLSKFDFQGKPHVFYDDHIQLLQRSDCFIARKIWDRADKLYDVFLSENDKPKRTAEPKSGKIDRIFTKSLAQRTKGRPGLVMQSRAPNVNWENGITASRYSMLQGYTELFIGFESWLAGYTGARVHGHLFAPERVEFANREPYFAGCLADNAVLRDYAPSEFLRNLIWNARGERQVFQYGPRDTQKVCHFIARDQNASISVVSGAWVVPLFHSGLEFEAIRKICARLQKVESQQLDILRAPRTRARVEIVTMAEFIQAPVEHLSKAVEEIGVRADHQLPDIPELVDLTGVTQFIQRLKNEGMHPYLMGDFSNTMEKKSAAKAPRKPYLMK